MGFKISQHIEPKSIFARTIELAEKMARAERVVVVVTTKEDGLEEKRMMFERLIQYIVDDHIKVFGFHAEMLKPGITKIGFDNEFNVELTPVPYADLFIKEDDGNFCGGTSVGEQKTHDDPWLMLHMMEKNTCSHRRRRLVNNGNGVYHTECPDCGDGKRR
jgi:hypothetical protein